MTTRPKIIDVQRVAKKYGLSHAIIVWADEPTGAIGYASWGKDKATCRDAEMLADELYSAALRYFGAAID